MADLGICRLAAPEMFTIRERSCERPFTTRKLSAIHSESYNGCSLACEDGLFSWSKSALGSGQIAQADLQSSTVRLFLWTVSQHISQRHYRQSEAELLGFDLGGASLHVSFPLV